MKETASSQISVCAFNHICISKIANLSAKNTMAWFHWQGLDYYKRVLQKYIMIWILRENDGTDSDIF